MDFEKEPTGKTQQPTTQTRSSTNKSVRSDVMQRLEVNAPVPGNRRQAQLYPYIKRLVDFIVSFLLIASLSPVLIVATLVLCLKKRPNVIHHTQKVGKENKGFNEYFFSTDQRFMRSLPVLANILRGDMSFIGPRAVSPDEWSSGWSDEALATTRAKVRPGLISDWWIRRKGNLDYVEELSLDVAYVENCCFSKDLSILFRALPGILTSVLWGDDPDEFDSTINILGVRIDNVSMQTAIGRIVGMLDDSRTQQVSFINPQNINVSFRHPDYRNVLKSSDLVLADGFGTKLAGKILHRPLCQNLCGTDLFPRLCETLSGTDRSIYLLGAAQGAAELVSEWVQKHYPEVLIKGYTHGYFTSEEEPELIRTIAESGADILVVSMGTPAQELFIQKYIDDLNVGVAIGFGGLFDYFSGRIPRAPQWVREIGMEWVYRLIQEPRRMWRRYLIGNGVFLMRVVHEKVRPQRYQKELNPD
jgi:N-acetylglucosaminyldiphosphoundecaprenol N-acetyl-beta-D-mannosaminyltransferase